ncbi:MAG: cupin domain-containing protein [Deltaproteobacteria bacterium]|nr:MAG: cupin domain-containing protein [Deltaproteobacteria bacterium]
MTEKLQFEELPITDKFMRQKRLIQERGELALIEDGESFQHLAYFSLKKGRGYYRGGHYHRNKVEHFYMVSGRVRVQLVDLEIGEKSEVILKAGQRVTIYPNCAHRFEAEEDAQVIEYYDSTYDPQDDIPYVEF